MAKIYSQLISAQAENKASDYSTGTPGRFWFNTGSSLLKFDDGSSVRTVVTTDNTQTLTNKTLGGLSFSTFAQGDLLYASAANTLNRLAVGSSGQVLKSNGTIPGWASSAQAASYSAKTHADTGYTITSSDDTILWTLTNGSNDTATLPSAASNAGKVYKIKLAASTAGFNTLTVSRAGSDTFTLADGTTGATSIVFYTGGETYEIQSDGTSVWQVLHHATSTGPNSFTPTGSWSTNTTYTGFWTRRGIWCDFDMKLALSGAPTSASLTINLPFTIDTSLLSGGTETGNQTLGPVAILDSGTTEYVGVVGYNTTTSVGIFASRADSTYTNTADAVTQAIPMTFATGDRVHVRLSVPISGWKA